MASYYVTSGVGAYLVIDGVDLAADEWNYSATTNVIDAPSFTGLGYMEYAVGKARALFTCHGTWDLNFNPFVRGWKQGQRIAARLVVRLGVEANTLDGIVQSWDVRALADGKVEYSLSIVPDYVFNDFANTPAVVTEE